MGEIAETFTAALGVAVLLVFVLITVWETLEAFWKRHTWREGENGLYVRDYTALKEWAKEAGGVALPDSRNPCFPDLMLGDRLTFQIRTLPNWPLLPIEQ